MKSVQEFKRNATFAVLTGVIAATIGKMGRFRSVPEEKVLNSSFKSVKHEAEKVARRRK